MSKSMESKATYDKGFNCCQAMIAVYGPELGYGRELMLKMGTAMGAGVAKSKETCGVVSGAVMVLGMKYGMKTSEDLNEKIVTYEKAMQFIELFTKKCGSCNCGKLTKGIDEKTKEGVARRDTLCSGLVEQGAKILENLL